MDQGDETQPKYESDTEQHNKYTSTFGRKQNFKRLMRMTTNIDRIKSLN